MYKRSLATPALATLALATLLLAGGPAAATTAETWDLTDLYADTTAWEAAFAQLGKELPALGDCRGRLGTGPEVLAKCLTQMSERNRALLRLFTHAYLVRDTDLRDSATNERFARAQSLYTRFGEITSFVAPELVALGSKKLEAWLASTPALAEHDFFIRETLRKGAHTLSPREEQLLAAAAEPMSAAAEAYQVLTNAELPWPSLTLRSGKEVKLSPSLYTQYRAEVDRSDRKAVFDAFFGAYQNYGETLAMTLSGQLKASTFRARARGFESNLAQALDGDAIPPKVYETLVHEVNANLPTLHRYLRLHGRILGIADLHYYDIYPATVAVERRYDLATSATLLHAAVAPLGAEYGQLLDASLNQRWMHARPAEGKRSGAYMMGSAYDTHPYLLLNHNDDFESLTTFAHEWGHAMHSLLANRAQPFTKASYPTFLAEIASIANEVLLYNHLRSTAATPREELSYLFEELQGLRGTFFRQTQFAEFELAAHREIETGGALSGAKLNRLYGDILKRYLGDAEGVVKIDDAYAVEWAYVPHFYTEFYVYQYATSLAAAYRLMETVLDGGSAERDAYLAILRAGGSAAPYPLLRKAGIDMADAEVYRAVIRRCNRLMDRIEALLSEHPELAQTPGSPSQG